MEVLDASGLLCPLPVLRARKRLGQLAPGDLLQVIATDPAAAIDLPHFCQQAGHDYLGRLAAETIAMGKPVYLIRCGRASAASSGGCDSAIR
ncbi:sulfurtransferase TusA family protein [Thioclava sp. BHET1]|nr:sulfurtransferase TusA family protein [Thioclava sp. BHET1]